MCKAWRNLHQIVPLLRRGGATRAMARAARMHVPQGPRKDGHLLPILNHHLPPNQLSTISCLPGKWRLSTEIGPVKPCTSKSLPKKKDFASNRPSFATHSWTLPNRDKPWPSDERRRLTHDNRKPKRNYKSSCKNGKQSC